MKIRDSLLIIAFSGIIFCLIDIHEDIKNKTITIYVSNSNNGNKNILTIDSILNTIKHNEGFSNVPYLCPSNKPTIGYGHQIRKNEEQLLKYVSKDKATLILMQDYTNAIFQFLINTNCQITDYDKVLAIAHFIYCFGITKFNNSTLKQKIINNQPIDSEITKWVNINNKPNKKLLETRTLELKWYNNNVNNN